MATEFLDKTGLTYLWGKLKDRFAPIASPTLTGTPKAPTASAGTNTTQIATTAFVKGELGSYIKNGDAIFSTSPFAGTSKVYIPKIDNALYCADKRWTVTAVYDGSDVSQSSITKLFNGDYDDTALAINGNKTAVITMDFTGDSTGAFPGYPYGDIFVSFYYVAKPQTITGRVYCNYQSQGIGWHNITFTNCFGSVYKAYNSYYRIQYIEITIVGDSTNSYGKTQLSEIEMRLDRPSPARNPFVSKYMDEVLYNKLTAPEFIGTFTGNATSATTATTATNVSASAGTANSARHVWFSDSSSETKRAYDDDLKYNPSTNVLTVGSISGTASNVSGTVAVDHGGTGATDAATARTNLGITPSNIGAAASSHAHGNITSAGALQTTDVSIASGDKLVVTDSSDSNKVARTSLSFDASTTTQALTKKGTFETFYQKPSGGIPSTDMASAVTTSLGKADTAYQKPSGGIPKTDLASAVQTSLGKADSAYQKPSTGIPSTDMASAVTTSLGKADTAYQKPSTGIPKTDLASAVQTSLGKADSAYQKPSTGIPSTDLAESYYLASNPSGYTSNAGTITGVSANGTSVATSGVANIPAASTSAYGVTKLSDSTSTTSSVLAATPTAVKAAYDLANGKYSKPSGGIPKTDLASAVQTSLGKADTAYQKPSGGIPGTDLADTYAKVPVRITISSVSSLPSTVTGKTEITADMVVQECVLSNPLAQIGDWTVTTTAGGLTVSGSISGTTDITLILSEVVEVS